MDSTLVGFFLFDNNKERKELYISLDRFLKRLNILKNSNSSPKIDGKKCFDTNVVFVDLIACLSEDDDSTKKFLGKVLNLNTDSLPHFIFLSCEHDLFLKLDRFQPYNWLTLLLKYISYSYVVLPLKEKSAELIREEIIKGKRERSKVKVFKEVFKKYGQKIKNG